MAGRRIGITPLVYQPKPSCATRKDGAGGIGSARKQEGRIMKTQRLLVVLTLVNLALLIFTLARTRPAIAEIVPVLRGKKPFFDVLFLQKGKMIELKYDLFTGGKMQ